MLELMYNVSPCVFKRSCSLVLFPCACVCRINKRLTCVVNLGLLCSPGVVMPTLAFYTLVLVTASYLTGDSLILSVEC